MIFTINGINDSAHDTTDRMAQGLVGRGHTVHRLRYPVVRFYSMGNRQLQYEYADELLHKVLQAGQGTDSIVAHSFGCLLVARMMELAGSFPFSQVFMYSPALDREWSFPMSGARRVYVVHNPKDRAVLYAKYLFRNPVGPMGRYGYKSPKTSFAIPVVTNREIRATFKGQRPHNAYFCGEHLHREVSWVDDKLKEAKDGAGGIL